MGKYWTSIQHLTREREKRANGRERWIRENGPCANCGSTNNLEIDHVDKNSKDPRLRRRRSLSSIWSWSEENRATELAKCQVLCHDCHTEKSYRERGYQHAQHGTRSMYEKGCRCAQCKRAMADYSAQRRKKKLMEKYLNADSV